MMNFGEKQNLNQADKGVFYRFQLDQILATPLTVENIDTFADDTLNRLIVLTREVVENYKLQTQSSDSIGYLEDKAYAEYGLGNIGDMLSEVQKKVGQIKAIHEYINKKSSLADEIITPPDKMEVSVGNGEVVFEKKKILPRLVTLFYILETDFDILKEDIKLIQGKNRDSMFRKNPYFRIEVPSLGRIVYICEEEDNASYVFDSIKLLAYEVSIESLDAMTKDERNVLIAKYADVGRRLIQTKHWRENLSDLLSDEITASQTAEEKIESETEITEKVSTSELDPWRGFWLDPVTGYHWSTANNIGRKLRIFHTGTTYRILKRKNFSEKTVLDLIGRKRAAYCYEELVADPEVIEYNIPSVETTGEWEGFYIDESQKHWATIRQLAKKFLRSGKFIEERLLGKILKKIRDSNGRLRDAYCYEDVLSPEDLASLDVPKATEIVGWEGFFIDEQTQIHWGSLDALHKKTGLARYFLEKIVGNKRTISIRSRHNQPVVAYPFEDVVSDPEVIKFMKTPKNNGTGEWKNFYINESGDHYGSIGAIARKLQKDHGTVFKCAKEFDSIEIISEGKFVTAYSYEALSAALSKNV